MPICQSQDQMADNGSFLFLPQGNAHELDVQHSSQFEHNDHLQHINERQLEKRIDEPPSTHDLSYSEPFAKREGEGSAFAELPNFVETPDIPPGPPPPARTSFNGKRLGKEVDYIDSVKPKSFLGRHSKFRNGMAASIIVGSIAASTAILRHAAHLPIVPQSVRNLFGLSDSHSRSKLESDLNHTTEKEFDMLKQLVHKAQDEGGPVKRDGADVASDIVKHSTLVKRSPLPAPNKDGHKHTPAHAKKNIFYLALGALAGGAAMHIYDNSLLNYVTASFSATKPSPDVLNQRDVKEDEWNKVEMQHWNTSKDDTPSSFFEGVDAADSNITQEVDLQRRYKNTHAGEWLLGSIGLVGAYGLYNHVVAPTMVIQSPLGQQVDQSSVSEKRLLTLPATNSLERLHTPHSVPTAAL